MEKRTMALPRWWMGITSAIVPPPIARAADPAEPAIKRKTISAGRFGATAQAIVKQRKTKLEVWYTGNRPWSSERGLQIRGPMTKPRTKMETTKALRILDWTPNSSMSMGTAAANIVDARGVISVMRETRKTVPQRRHGAQFRGFVGSSSLSQPTIYVFGSSGCRDSPETSNIAVRVCDGSSSEPSGPKCLPFSVR